MTIYIVRRYDGTYLQYGFNWTTNMTEAQVYTKPGPAKGRVTRWARAKPNEPVLNILSFTFTEADATIMDMTEVTIKKVNAKARRKLEVEARRKQEEIVHLQEEQSRIQSRLAALKPSIS